jgi:hypothetical protein
MHDPYIEEVERNKGKSSASAELPSFVVISQRDVRW